MKIPSIMSVDGEHEDATASNTDAPVTGYEYVRIRTTWRFLGECDTL
ncbi:hypothetical protein [Amycolatopsis sp. DSM 110486]|nr:hypothetical protein [Amycolatopsis sp. DSM 110486]QYN21496.1 hypothetical protein K1T34_02810 [Amycolatopsis sp. DSM 110486]